MTDDVAAFLDAVETRTAAATEGPWEWRPGDVYAHGVYAPTARCWAVEDADLEETDAAFIAAARSDVPVLVAGWRKVLALHEPTDANEHSGWRWCTECSDPENGMRVGYPCATVSALVEALSPTPTPTAEETK